MTAIGRLIDWLENAFAVVAAILLVFTVITVPLDVGSRYFFGRPLTWVFEVTEYILLFIPCLGMAWLARNNGHIAIDIVTARLADTRRHVLQALAMGVAAYVCGVIAWWGAVATTESLRANALIENVLQTPQWIVYIVIPLGFGLCAVEFLRKAIGALVQAVESR